MFWFFRTIPNRIENILFARIVWQSSGYHHLHESCHMNAQLPLHIYIIILHPAVFLLSFNNYNGATIIEDMLQIIGQMIMIMPFNLLLAFGLFVHLAHSLNGWLKLQKSSVALIMQTPPPPCRQWFIILYLSRVFPFAPIQSITHVTHPQTVALVRALWIMPKT